MNKGYTSRTKERTKVKRWIPPPALTSKQQRNKSLLREVSDSDISDGDDINFEEKLQNLLLNIRRLKSDGSLDENEKPITEQDNLFACLMQDTKGPEPAFIKVTDSMKADLQDEIVYQRSLVAVKNELQKNLSENERLTKEQKILMDKLNVVDRNATEAMQHLTSLRNFLNKLSKGDGVQNQCISKETNETFDKQVLKRLDQLEQANNSLQKLIQAISKPSVPSDSSTSHSESDGKDPNNVQQLDIHKLTDQVKSLLNQVAEDHTQISNLQNVIAKTKLAALEDTEELKKLVNIHKDRAEKYLSSVDSLKLQLSQKTSETGVLKQDINSLKLKITRLMSERDRLEIEKTTLSRKLVTTNLEIQHQHFAIASQLQIDELSTKLVQASSKRAQLEVENEKLKSLLAGAKTEVEEIKMELQKQSKELQDAHSRTHAMNNHNTDKLLDKSTQAAMNESRISSSRSLQNQIGQDQLLHMTELWKQLQSDKLNIIQTLKDLEKKLENTQESNLEFRRELAHKEELMQEVNIRLEEKINENKSLKQLLESALSDAKRYSEKAQEMSLNKDYIIQTQMADLERKLQEYKKENLQLRNSNSELEKNLHSQIKELQERLDLAEKSKKTMHDYILFLKSSYANVFGEGSLATKNYPF